MSIGSTLPYNLRPKKAVERNLFFDLLRMLERQPEINFLGYHYVGFGAAFLEDFKALHNLFGINSMHCLEGSDIMHKRQLFNNPFSFIKYIPEMSTKYIPSAQFVQNMPQIVWLDYTTPAYFQDQLTDLYNLGSRLASFDVVKFTFNALLYKFKQSHKRHDDPAKTISKLIGSELLTYLQDDHGYQLYLPEKAAANYLEEDTFATLQRGMGLKALRTGLSEINDDLRFIPLSAFEYADGQKMTTLTGICLPKGLVESFIAYTQLTQWPFYSNQLTSEIFPAHDIVVPDMTILERMSIDRLLPENDPRLIFEKLGFHYGDTIEEHDKLINGYTKYYRYLPHFGKITM